MCGRHNWVRVKGEDLGLVDGAEVEVVRQLIAKQAADHTCALGSLWCGPDTVRPHPLNCRQVPCTYECTSKHKRVRGHCVWSRVKIVTRIAWLRCWLEAQRQPKLLAQLAAHAQLLPSSEDLWTSLLSHGVISPNCQQVQSDSERARRHQAGLLGVQARVR